MQFWSYAHFEVDLCKALNYQHKNKIFDRIRDFTTCLQPRRLCMLGSPTFLHVPTRRASSAGRIGRHDGLGSHRPSCFQAVSTGAGLLSLQHAFEINSVALGQALGRSRHRRIADTADWPICPCQTISAHVRGPVHPAPASGAGTLHEFSVKVSLVKTLEQT